MTTMGPERDDHQARSAFVRGVVQRTGEADPLPAAFLRGPRRTIVQYWDDLGRLPDDVGACIESWKQLEARGFEVRLFDYDGARELIASRLGPRYERAYLRCYHPAMQSDYFRLCYILVEGGCYVDADDVYKGPAIERLFDDGRLKIQPLCYDVETGRMIPQRAFTQPGAHASSWIFYFNNNPLLAVSGHPIIKRALANATAALERATSSGLPEIQSSTGPGNLTRSIFELAQQDGAMCEALLVLRDWEDVASSQWPLSYRGDARNWRLSNCRVYQPTGLGHR